MSDDEDHPYLILKGKWIVKLHAITSDEAAESFITFAREHALKSKDLGDLITSYGKLIALQTPHDLAKINHAMKSYLGLEFINVAHFELFCYLQNAGYDLKPGEVGKLVRCKQEPEIRQLQQFVAEYLKPLNTECEIEIKKVIAKIDRNTIRFLFQRYQFLRAVIVDPMKLKEIEDIRGLTDEDLPRLARILDLVSRYNKTIFFDLKLAVQIYLPLSHTPIYLEEGRYSEWGQRSRDESTPLFFIMLREQPQLEFQRLIPTISEVKMREAFDAAYMHSFMHSLSRILSFCHNETLTLFKTYIDSVIERIKDIEDRRKRWDLIDGSRISIIIDHVADISRSFGPQKGEQTMKILLEGMDSVVTESPTTPSACVPERAERIRTVLQDS